MPSWDGHYKIYFLNLFILAMRRKGISGTQQQQQGGSVSTMDKISLMIPSLPDDEDENVAEDESSDDDWNN